MPSIPRVRNKSKSARSRKSPLTHFDTSGAAHMVDVAAKDQTHRIAVAEGDINMLATTLQIIKKGSAKKGDVLGIARVAAILATKKTADIIPLAHPIELTRVRVEFDYPGKMPTIRVRVTAETLGRTGVEMESLTGAAAALLTIYDMCKAVDRGMTISRIRLIEKVGGKSGHYYRA